MTARITPRRLLTVGLVAAALWYLGSRIARDAHELRSFDWRLDPAMLALSLLLQIGVLVFGVWVWRRLLSRFGAEVEFRPLARAWFLSNLSKYIPGSVWQFVSLAQLSGGAGLTGAGAVTSVLVHTGFLLLAAGAVAVHLLPVALAPNFAVILTVLRWLSPAALVLVHPAVIGTAMRAAGRLSRGAVQPWRGSWLDGVVILLLSVLAWGISGVAFFTFVRAFVPLPLSALPALVAANALGFFFGTLVVFAPGGIGIKEGVLSMLLAGLMPVSVATSMSVASRLWSIAAEVLPALFLVRARARGTPDPAQTPPVPGA